MYYRFDLTIPTAQGMGKLLSDSFVTYFSGDVKMHEEVEQCFIRNMNRRNREITLDPKSMGDRNKAVSQVIYQTIFEMFPKFVRG
jgi:hypothetical protein